MSNSEYPGIDVSDSRPTDSDDVQFDGLFGA